jgi:hypothetical protein
MRHWFNTIAARAEVEVIRDTIHDTLFLFRTHGVHCTHIKPLVDGGASIAPDHVDDVSELSDAADGFRFAIHGSIEFAGTVSKPPVD